MYYKLKLADKVRVPAHRLGEDLRVVLLDVLQEQLEGSIDKEIGIFIVVTAIDEIGKARLSPGMGRCTMMSRLKPWRFALLSRRSLRACC